MVTQNIKMYKSTITIKKNKDLYSERTRKDFPLLEDHSDQITTN